MYLNIRTMKKLIILFIVPIFFGFKTGQEIDENKMNRDLEIAKNILATLIKTGSDSFYGGTSIEASYIKDYGVIFTIPEHLVYFHSGRGALMPIPDIPPMPDFDMSWDMDVDVEFEMSDELQEQEYERLKEEMLKHKEEFEVQKEEFEVQKREFEKQKREMKKAQRQAGIEAAKAPRTERIYISSGEKTEINWEEIMITFLTDYADLIGQLQPSDKIVIHQRSPYDELVFIWEGYGVANDVENEKSGISAEVYRKDVKEYKTGKIDKVAFKKRIKISKKEPHKKIADLEMFASIFDRYYSHDLSETFFSEEKPRYEVLDGYGVVFHIKAASANHSNGRVYFYTPGDSRSWNAKPDQKSDDDKIYLQFKSDIKAFMLDYGRTIRSLADKDKVMLEIRINSCRDCKVPKILEVSSKMSLLKQYDQQKISREKALTGIEIKEQF